MSNIFIPTLNQILFLLILIFIGFILRKTNILPENSAKVLSLLETYVFVPAVVLSTFLSNFTFEKLENLYKYFIAGIIVVVILILFALLFVNLFKKEGYLKKIYTYALAFPNFGFMGIAVAKALFSNIFLEYLMFIIPFYIAIYAWGIPKLLIPSDKGKKGIIKTLINPMFIAMIIGIIFGLINLKLPLFIDNSVNTLGNLMSPIAMILTGITVSKVNFKETFISFNVYILSVIRLLLIPLIFIGILSFVKIDISLKVCIMCAVSMPLGLNTIVIPTAYDFDTSEASSMALVSHVLSLLTIPLIFSLFELINK